METLELTPESVEAAFADYLTRPNDYIHDVYGLNPWSLQKEIVDAVFKYREVSVKTCNSIGKSYIAAAIAHAFLDLHPASIVVTTAPTWSQVKDVLWRYIGRIHSTAKYSLGGRINQTGLEYDNDWYAIGRSTNYAENLFGYHADHILVIVDEAGGVEDPIFRGVKAITPNVNAHVLYIGNPTNPDGYFAQTFENPRIKHFSLSAFDSPNLKHVGISNLEELIAKMTPPQGVNPLDFNPFEGTKWPIPELISPEVVYDRYIDWGVDSPAWQALIMGEFPSQAEAALIPADLVRMAMEMRGVDEDSGKTYAELSGWQIPDGPDEYGQDMARFGSDLNVNFHRKGGLVDEANVWNKKGDEKLDLMASADRIITILDNNIINPDARVNIDDTGNGGGTTDRLRQIGNQERTEKGHPVHQYQLAAYNFASKERMSNPDKFHDITSELYWNLAGWFKRKQIALYYDKQLFNELVGRRWRINPSGKIQVESKDDYKKRTGGKSPDRSDALALAFAGGTRQFRVPLQENTELELMRKPFTAGLSKHGW